jgi:hypothetical protein
MPTEPIIRRKEVSCDACGQAAQNGVLIEFAKPKDKPAVTLSLCRKCKAELMIELIMA